MNDYRLRATDWPGLVYAVTLLLGGIFGFIKTGSKASLIAGSSIGLTLLYVSLPIFLVYFQAGKKEGSGTTSSTPGELKSRPVAYRLYVGLTLSLLMATVMGARYASRGKFMPAGLVFILSAGMVARYAYLIQSTSAASA